MKAEKNRRFSSYQELASKKTKQKQNKTNSNNNNNNNNNNNKKRSINQSVFDFMSVHIEVIIDTHKRKSLIDC